MCERMCMKDRDALYPLMKRVVDNKEISIIIAGIGQGKTYASMNIVKDVIRRGKKAIYISHYLVSQDKFIEEFKSYGVEPIYVYNSGLSTEEKEAVLNVQSGLIICTVEALMLHKQEFLSNCEVIIYDENHLVSEETYREAYSEMMNLMMLCKLKGIAFIGLTATWFTDFDIKDIFNSSNGGFIDVKIYDTGLKSKVAVKRWFFTQLARECVDKRNIAGLIAAVLDNVHRITGCRDYDYIMVYCNNVNVGLRLQKGGYPRHKRGEFKIVCSEIRTKLLDVTYNKEPVFDKLVNDEIDFNVFATEAIVNGLNFHSVKGKVLCVVVTDETNCIHNACQFCGRFRQADHIDVVQLNICRHRKLNTNWNMHWKWEKIRAHYRKLHVMMEFVKNQYEYLEQVELVDLRWLRPVTLPGSSHWEKYRRALKVASKFGVSNYLIKPLVKFAKRMRKREFDKADLRNLLTVTIASILYAYGRRLNDDTFAVDNELRDEVLMQIGLMRVPKSNVLRCVNSAYRKKYYGQKVKLNGHWYVKCPICDHVTRVDKSKKTQYCPICHTKLKSTVKETVYEYVDPEFIPERVSKGVYYRLFVKLLRMCFKDLANVPELDYDNLPFWTCSPKQYNGYILPLRVSIFESTNAQCKSNGCKRWNGGCNQGV